MLLAALARMPKSLFHLLLISVIVLCSQKLQAEDVEIDVVIFPRMANTSVCNFLLRRAPEIISNSSLIAIGDIRDLQGLMARVGVSEIGVEFVVSGFRKILKQMAGVKEMNKLSTDLLMTMPGETALAICVGTKDCQLSRRYFEENAQVGWMDTEGSSGTYEIGTLLGPFNIEKESAEIWLKSDIDLQSTELVVVRPFDITSFNGVRASKIDNRVRGTISQEALRAYIQFMGEFFREISKYSAMKLVSQWVKANMVMISRSRVADPFFRKYVRLKSNGMLQIDRNFLMTFLYSYSVLAEVTAEALVMSEFMRENALYNFITFHKAGRIHEGLKGLQSHVSVQKLRAMGIDEDTFLNYSKQHAHIMELSIGSAARHISN